MEDSHDEAVLLRLRKIEGQIKGLQRMISESRSCDEVLTQVLAARAALDKVAFEVLSAHIEDCLATQPPERARATIRRAVELLQRVG